LFNHKLLLFVLIALTQQVQATMKNGYLLKNEEKCGNYPKVSVGTQEGSCLGLVASEEDGLIRPRRIVQLPGGDFIITDMVRWGKDKGIVWRLSPNKNEKKLTKILTNIDHAHGLALGPDGLVYVGTRATIFRFNANNPLATKEVIIDDLPGDGNHPMSHFIFDQDGHLIVNVGAPTDQCQNENKVFLFPCPENKNEALLRRYFRDSQGNYNDFSVIARGLRNSMALAINPVTQDLFQGENNMDFKELHTPAEEINLISDNANYGWPYCYANGLLNPNYKKHASKIKCNNTRSPIALLPAHSAPLDMLFYEGDMFPELHGKLLVSLHGYRETGHRIVSLSVNESFMPVGSTKSEIVNEWTAREGLNPKGSPVGMTVAHDGSIWFVEDKNKTVMVLRKGKESNGNDRDRNIKVKPLGFFQKMALRKINRNVLQKKCTTCHGQLDLDVKGLHKELVTSGWIKPGNADKSLLFQRIIGTQRGRQMPPEGKKVSASEIKSLKSFINSL
jgi:glucose/arabinose dehydrogenase